MCRRTLRHYRAASRTGDTLLGTDSSAFFFRANRGNRANRANGADRTNGANGANRANKANKSYFVYWLI